MTIVDFLNLLESKEFYDFIRPWKIISVFVSMMFIYGIWYYISKQETFLHDMKRRTQDFLSFQKFSLSKVYQNRAKEISRLLEKKEYKRAVVKTESLFYEILSGMKFDGKKLKDIAENPNVPNNENLKRLAEIAEEMKTNHHYAVNIEELSRLYETFEDSLIKLGIIGETEEKK